MYLEDGFVGAIMVGLAVLAVPVAWVAWWFLASLGEAAAYGSAHTLRQLPVTRRQPAA
jgi:hypothetical protein